MMQRIQSLFNRLAGVASFEADHLALAQAIYGDGDRRFLALEAPAYLRRKVKIMATCTP
jgi:hypothetical protein